MQTSPQTVGAFIYASIHDMLSVSKFACVCACVYVCQPLLRNCRLEFWGDGARLRHQ